MNRLSLGNELIIARGSPTALQVCLHLRNSDTANTPSIFVSPHLHHCAGTGVRRSIDVVLGCGKKKRVFPSLTAQFH
ncbi:hypothetical protein VFPPC_18161 [Pochonia chlamydosporia 170]|uniref:Uncharacterized protein n=1 Tax=Pochonia chlamydosporia 170 TaxID=1380566 RepID=A0A219AS82_METCM|nr:hypothetical protein VFPPC_18161 [Pochonia chlamydosporia 170]OWT43636.1 hypothetical protein VFPPC_18161 [Pochonia chlamydosporia 170]